MMYLSRLLINPQCRQVRSEIANPYEMHRTIMHAFADHLKEGERVLFRLEIESKTGIPALLVQSQSKPTWNWLSESGMNYLIERTRIQGMDENPAVKSFELHLHAGQKLTFRLKANPTIKRKNPDLKEGKRVGIYAEDGQIIWLQRKFSNYGARILSVRCSQDEQLKGSLHRNNQKHELIFTSVQFDGAIEVIHPEMLIQAVKTGIGSAKGFGFGLLSLAKFES